MPITYVDPEGNTHTLSYPCYWATEQKLFLVARREDGVIVNINRQRLQGYMSQVPFHKSERMFRRYEGQIHAILSALPQRPIAFDPTPFAPQTALCRLRDSINSVLEYRWETSLDLKALAALRPQIEFVIQAGQVVVRSKLTREPLSPASSDPLPVAQEVNFGLILDKPDLNTLEAVALLHSKRVLSHPTKLIGVSRLVLDDLAQRFDIAINEELDHCIMF